MFGSCWLVVAVMADDEGFVPPAAGGLMTMIGIEAIPEPMVVDRVFELSVEVSASPVLNSMAA